MSFTKTVKSDNDTLTITVSCKLRRFAYDQKEIFEEDIENFIPEQLKGKVILVESPSKKISNINSNSYTNVGVWKFQIQKPKQEQKKQQRTRTVKSTTRKQVKEPVKRGPIAKSPTQP